jgi:hypothetical protein
MAFDNEATINALPQTSIAGFWRRLFAFIMEI